MINYLVLMNDVIRKERLIEKVVIFLHNVLAHHVFDEMPGH